MGGHEVQSSVHHKLKNKVLTTCSIFSLLNIESVNRYILCMSYSESPVITRFQFVKAFTVSLVTLHLAGERIHQLCDT